MTKNYEDFFNSNAYTDAKYNNGDVDKTHDEFPFEYETNPEKYNKIFEIYEKAIEGKIDFKELHTILDEYEDLIINEEIFDTFVKYKEEKGDYVDQASVTFFSELLDNKTYLEHKNLEEAIKLFDQAIEGGKIDFKKISTILDEDGDLIINEEIFNSLLEYKRSKGENVDTSNVEVLSTLVSNKQLQSRIGKYAEVWDKIIDGKASPTDLFSLTNEEDTEAHLEALNLCMLQKGNLNAKQASNLIMLKEIMSIDTPDLRKDVITALQTYSNIWDKSPIMENKDDEGYNIAFEIYMNKQRREHPERFETKSILAEELRSQHGELHNNPVTTSQSIRFERRLDAHEDQAHGEPIKEDSTYSKQGPQRDFGGRDR